ncbi:MAG TPA: hypothetical protein VMB50_06350, partial [Myxococcales bacterium]|nr:hypothetical protein [Myxococcales bacterium]
LIVPLHLPEIEPRLRLLVADYRPTLNPWPLSVRGWTFRMTLWLNRYERVALNEHAILVTIKGSFDPEGRNSRVRASFRRGFSPGGLAISTLITAFFAAMLWMNGAGWKSLMILILPLCFFVLLLQLGAPEIQREQLRDLLRSYLGEQAPQSLAPPLARPIDGGGLLASLLSIAMVNAFVDFELWKAHAGPWVMWGLATLSVVPWGIFFFRWLTRPTPPDG